jgi:hypothetical protein
MMTSMQRQHKPDRRFDACHEIAAFRRPFSGCVHTVCAALLLSSGLGVAAQQPQVPLGLQRPGQQGPRDPAEASAFSAAVNEPNPGARISAIQQFLLSYPNSTLRQAAINQMMLAKRQNLSAGGESPLAGNHPAPPQAAAAPSPATQPTVAGAPPADSLLQHPAKHAEVTLAAHTLAVKADNSALSQILRDIASSTGMQFDGLSKDERIFGNYGPGEPREVLLALLEGSGYNVVMVGATPGGAPRQLSLSQRVASTTPASTPNRSNSAEEDDDDQEVQQAPQPEPPQPVTQPPPGNPPGGDGQQPPRSPQEILQELQRLRQQGQQPNQQPQ